MSKYIKKQFETHENQLIVDLQIIQLIFNFRSVNRVDNSREKLSEVK